jgi:sulfopropanediol 3-dehydrogenase
VCTYQKITPEANTVMSPVASRLSRIEGMEGHAQACDWWLSKYYPEEGYDFEVYRHGIK